MCQEPFFVAAFELIDWALAGRNGHRTPSALRFPDGFPSTKYPPGPPRKFRLITLNLADAANRRRNNRGSLHELPKPTTTAPLEWPKQGVASHAITFAS